ncbi:DNA polymerase I [Maledivibacter halophilus]|uniref:DNA polymerase I n=1 Tax=Maledivibacter halophilus TaxID=36842 RepID=A0A1T5KKF2_9FIRM|nr:DNA polymerase I [Maledivibacter halophilus]SKC64244.1 DNA polymerase I [Maledivibacter halophilus]
MKKRLIIIDGNSLINRAFYALPDLTTREGIHTNGVFGFIKMVNKIHEDYKPNYLSVAFDLKAPTFRHIQYKEYKAQRKKMPEELAQQMPILKEILDAYGIHRTELEGFEADDLIGTIARFCEERDFEVIIVTGDRDALQLVSDNVKVMITKRGITNLEVYDRDMVKEKYGVTPEQIIDFKGLVGDKSDNIPGVPGVGEKTASKLLNQFSTVEELIKNVDSISSKSHRKKIEENIEIALLSKRLATIKTDIPLEIDIEELKIIQPDKKKLMELFKKYEFNSLVKTLTDEDEGMDNDGLQDIKKLNVEIIKKAQRLDEIIKMIKNKKSFAIKIFKEENNIITDNIIGISISVDLDNNFYINIKDNEKLLDSLKEVFENKEIKKFGHELKKEIISLLRYDIVLRGIEFDSFIAAYLLEPSQNDYDISDLVLKYLEVKISSKEEILGKGKNAKKYSDLSHEDLSIYGGNTCYSVLKLKELLYKELEKNELIELFEKIEMPLIEVLASLEYEGFKVDKEALKELDEELTVKIEEITNEIYQLSGEEFNINSPKQLGVILFDKLGLPVIKKTKTGYSTSHDVLEKLYKRHPIIPLLIEYRQLVKLKSTYIDGLFNLINPITGKIHSSFNQTVTVTGRISSTEPNLQNIPIRLEIGRRIRKVFVPHDDNHSLIDADYSQIELRVLAHMSKDENLIKAFKEDDDIHTITASQVFNVPIDKVTSLERGRAKAVNFGIVYGISDFGLATNLNITRKEAKKYIDEYFKKYKGVKEYMDNEVEKGKEFGYVTTILKRRRYLPELKSRNFNIRSFGERTAMNTPIQGSAADIIKIAMVKVFNELRNRNLKSKLILQVHDELIIDACNDELDEVKKLLKKNMEKAIDIDVPLKVDMNTGENWYNTK